MKNVKTGALITMLAALLGACSNTPVATPSAIFSPTFADVVMQHGKYLMENPKLAIRVEGNTDERGGSEYNLALGQKRAEAVRRALKVYGVTDAQVEAVSWGEERPKAKSHDEADWQQNRLAELQYPLK